METGLPGQTMMEARFIRPSERKPKQCKNSFVYAGHKQINDRLVVKTSRVRHLYTEPGAPRNFLRAAVRELKRLDKNE